MNAYDIKKGRYWFASGPDGDFVVFWHHPDEGKIHHQIAVFFDADRASRYVSVENQLLIHVDHVDAGFDAPVTTADDPIASHARRGRPPGSAAQQFDELCAKVRNDLPDLFARYPDGITTRNIMDDYDAPYERVCQLLRFLESAELGRYVYVHGKGGPKIFIKPDAEYTSKKLSDQQQAVLHAMLRAADSYGIVSRSHRRIATDAHVSPGSISMLQLALEKKGFLMLAKPAGGSGGEPATYQITDKGLAAAVVEELA